MVEWCMVLIVKEDKEGHLNVWKVVFSEGKILSARFCLIFSSLILKFVSGNLVRGWLRLELAPQ